MIYYNYKDRRTKVRRGATMVWLFLTY